ncbi:HNH endonuclease signature motif containing protein [Mycobacterium sp. B14F4]|uniref:HNH endonuclease signature motif containing protein n=1 Tax=Mycobacterium sp. B14F4 TaxID=3153565 RepID=UPI00325E65F6
MFEEPSDAELISLIGEETREESAAMGRRLELIGELFARRRRQLREARFFATDPYAATAAELSPIQNLSHHRALSQVHTAATLRERLPLVGKVLRSGLIDWRMLATILARTDNVDDEIMPTVDAALARSVTRWMKLSEPKLRDRIDMIVANHDPAAVRVPPKIEQNRHVDIYPSDTAGMAWINAHVRAEDGAALDQRLDALAATVCQHDPRTREQRRADACGPLARRKATLACRCGREDCPAAAQRDAAASAVIHLLAEQATLDGTGDTPGYLPGFGMLPADSVRDIAESAQLKPVTIPGADCPADPGYQPTAKTKEFIQWRDLTCRWPGCDKPAWKSDIDHTTPWPCGPTHPSNNKCYCRIHHLIKSFVPGWAEHHLPDGTLLLTSPTGHLYRSEAHGASLFPALGQLTGELNLPPGEPNPDRTAMAPRRKQTREQDRRDRITAERRERTELIADEERQRQAWLAANYQPPPF